MRALPPFAAEAQVLEVAMTPRQRTPRQLQLQPTTRALEEKSWGVVAPRHHATPGQLQQRCHLVAPGGSSKLRGAKEGATLAEFKVGSGTDSGLMNLRRNNGFRASSSLAFLFLERYFQPDRRFHRAAVNSGIRARHWIGTSPCGGSTIGPCQTLFCSKPSGWPEQRGSILVGEAALQRSELESLLQGNLGPGFRRSRPRVALMLRLRNNGRGSS